MSKLLKFAVMGTALVASATVVSAKARNTANPGTAFSSYAMELESGPYVAPPKKVEPRQAVLPFTWEEKRHFDLASAGDGD